MINTIILCKSFEIAKIIINKILYDIPEVKIVGLYNDANQISNAIKKSNPDLIISTNKKIISVLKKDELLFSQKIILIANSNQKLSNYKDLLIINVHTNINSLTKKISSFIKNNFNISRKEKITNILKNLGFDFKLSGTIYLIDAILYASSFKGYYSFEKIYKDIYPHVAKQNGTDPDKVKWSIERTIRYMCKKHSKETYAPVEDYFGVCYPEKPTPKTIIGLIANDIINTSRT